MSEAIVYVCNVVLRIDIWLVDIAISKINLAHSPSQALSTFDS